MPTQVLVADDHHIVRQGLKAVLEREGFEVVAEAANGQEAVEMAAEHQPEVAVLDTDMPLMNGLDAAREMQRVSPKTKVVLITMHTEHHRILEGLRSGVTGIVIKTHAAEDLVRAIREALRGVTYLSPEISKAVVQAYKNRA
jgi:two-component system, NarL family, response regulator NreC